MRDRTTMRLVIAAALVLCACPRPRTAEPVFEVAEVTSACPAAGADPAERCTVEAQVRTRDPAGPLAVVAVTDGDRDVAWVVVPTAGGGGRLRRSGLRSPSRSPRLGARLVGIVAEPVARRLSVAGVTTACDEDGPGTLSCRTAGRVECSGPEPFRVVVEVRSASAATEDPASGARAWGIVRLDEGKAPFSVEWRRPAAGPGAEPAVEVRAVGIVVRAPERP